LKVTLTNATGQVKKYLVSVKGNMFVYFDMYGIEISGIDRRWKANWKLGCESQLP